MKSLFCIFLFMLVIMIIFYPLHASSTEKPKHNEARNNHSNDEPNRHIEIVNRDLVVGSPKFDVNKTS